jgi:two-component system sensor histidine kinase KdpD
MKIQGISRWVGPLRIFRVLWQSVLAWAVIVALAYCGFILRVNVMTITSLYLLIVVAVASFCGFWQASLTSFIAVACLDFLFLPPLLHFNITDPQDSVALVTFEVTALVISRLSTKELRSAREAIFHRTGMEKLYELSRHALLMDLREPPGTQLVLLIHRVFDVRAVALFDNTLGRQDRMGDWDAGEEDVARLCFQSDGAKDDRKTDTAQRLLQSASGPVGALIVRGRVSPLVVDALASLVAIAIDRHQSFEKEEKAEAARRGEQMRAAVMDSLGHELKTPLTTVQTASSGLLEMGGLTESQHDLAKLIDDEALRLNALCRKLLLTAKLEAEQLGLAKGEANVRELISDVLVSWQVEGLKDRIEVVVPDPALTVSADRGLLAMILTQYIDNAAKYSAPGTPIKIAAEMSGTEVLISVQNYGSKIRSEDRERIFDRFYRALDMKDSVPGTGIGLSVVRKAAEAHHGHVWVVSEEQGGTTFFLSLPGGTRREV